MWPRASPLPSSAFAEIYSSLLRDLGDQPVAYVEYARFVLATVQRNIFVQGVKRNEAPSTETVLQREGLSVGLSLRWFLCVRL